MKIGDTIEKSISTFERSANDVQLGHSNHLSMGHDNKGNELTHLLPGYTAPMYLEAKSLKGISGLSLSELRRQAEKREAAIYKKSISILTPTVTSFDPASIAKKVITPSFLAVQKSKGQSIKIPTTFASSFRKNPKKVNDSTAGEGWFGMVPTPMTDQLKTDLSIIRNRNYLDPKKFYKSVDSFDGKVLQVGTVIEGSAEYFSSRLTKRERRQNLTEEIMADPNVANYTKRKCLDLQMQKKVGTKRFKGTKRKRK